MREPQENPERWRQKMAQATTALTAGWLSEKMLNLNRYSNTDNANTIWRRLCNSHSRVTGLKQMQLKDRVERCVQRQDESLADWLAELNMNIASLEASGFNADDDFRKNNVRHSSNEKFRPLITQVALINPDCSYEEFQQRLLEAAADSEERSGRRGQAYYAASRGRTSNARSRNGFRGRRSNSQRGRSFSSTANVQQRHSRGRSGGRNYSSRNGRGRSARGDTLYKNLLYMPWDWAQTRCLPKCKEGAG